MEREDLLLTPSEKADKERESKVYKADSLVQRARYSLSLIEQRFVLYAISKIKQDDPADTKYRIDLRDFQRVCGTDSDQSYNYTKGWIKKLADKSWWMADGKSDVLVRWFSSIRITRQSGLVEVKFHEDMFPHLFRLAEQMRENGQFYTGYTLRNILPMKSTYSIRIYELLKSYQKNNRKWWFEIGELKKLLDCENYVRFPDFRRYVLEPAEREINLYTDIKVKSSTVNQGRKVVAIEFTMLNKTHRELVQANHDGLTEIEGAVHYWDIDQTSAKDEG